MLKIGVIVGGDLVGDALIKLPFLRALKTARPDAEIHWITALGKTAFSGALSEIAAPLLAGVHDRPDWLARRGHVKVSGAAPFFDVLIDTRGFWLEAWRARRSVPHEIFIDRSMGFLLSDKRPPLFSKKPARLIDRLMQMATLAVEPCDAAPEIIFIPQAVREKAAAVLPEGKIYVGLVPGAGNKIKIWPRENFVALAKEQIAAGRVPVFLLGPEEKDWQSELAAAVPGALFPLQDIVWGGAVSIVATMAVGERLALAVTNDCGTSHMLAAVDCPLVSLFGPTSPEKFAPAVSKARVVAARDFGGREMERIPLSAVSAAVESLLE